MSKVTLFKKLSIEKPKRIWMIWSQTYFTRQNLSGSLPEIALDGNTDIKIKSNKSGLLKQHRNILNRNIPYTEPHSWIHLSEKYQRKLFGLYGIKSGVSPRICFASTEATHLQSEYQRIREPHSLPEMISKVLAEKQEQHERMIKHEEEINKKLEKLEQWKSELNAKIARREADTLAAIERKERLINEVRRHFGFKVDPRDERFKEMLEQKEKEYKKKEKEAKKKAKEEKMMSKLLKKSA